MAKTTITAAEFVSIWTCEDRDNPDWQEYYEEEDAAYGGKRTVVIFKDVDITGNVFLKDEPSPLLRITLKNSTLRTLNISNCQLSYFTIEATSEVGSIDLGVDVKVEYLKVSGSAVTNISIWGGGVSDFIILEKQAVVTTISLESEGTKGGYIHVSDSDAGLIEVTNRAAVTDIDISRSRVNYLYVHDYAVADNIKITDNSICLGFKIYLASIREQLYIENSKINNFFIQVRELAEANILQSFIQELEYRTLISTTFNVIDCTLIKFIMQKVRTGKDSLIQLINCKVNDLKFDTVLNLASFNIKNITALKEGEKFKYSNFDNIGSNKIDRYEMLPFKCQAQLSILSSDMGKIMFSSDLSGFDKFYFANSKIIEAFIAGPKLPALSTIDGENLDEQNRIAYNQIKRIYENRGDNITAMKYQQKEMEIYRRQLINKSEDKIPGEQFQLLFSQFTNRHGTQWQFPLILAISLGIIFYVSYCICLFGLSLHGDFKWALVPYFFEFLNPAHKVNFIKEFSLNNNNGYDNCALIIDAVSRIIIPLLLYQMIQAFRKYGKR